MVVKSLGKIVTRLPLDALWLDEGGSAATRGEYLNQSDMKRILAQQLVQFVVADIGYKLNWIAPAQCYTFWKSEVKHHVADPSADIYLDHYPDEYAYLASEWIRADAIPIILLEKIH